MNDKIIQLTAENVKRLRAISIKPDGALVVIGGANGAGKTSVLDSITYALAGGKSLPKVPVRRGEDKATVELDLGDLLIKRTFTSAGGTSLTVTNKAGLKYPSPQAMLDALVGKLSFDPLEFSRAKPEVQSETLRNLVGLDFTAKNQERQKIYDDRTLAGRELKQLEARVAALPPPKAGIPDSEVSAENILAEQRKAQEHNQKNERARADARGLRSQANFAASTEKAVRTEVNRLAEEIKRLTEKLRQLQSEMSQTAETAEELRRNAEAEEEKIKALQDIDLSQFSAKLREVEATNQLVRANRQRNELAEQVKAKRKSVEALTSKVDAIDKDKADMIAAAKFPIDGLTFDDGEVMFNGLPFSQASAAEQLRVSVAIGLALNPKLRVLLIRDGSLLDEHSLTLLQEMASAADAQVWLEVVGSDGECQVIIEDGMVSAAKQEPKEELQLK